MVDDHVNWLVKTEYKYKPHLVEQNSTVMSIRRFQKELKINHGTDLIRGKKMKVANKEVAKTFARNVETLHMTGIKRREPATKKKYMVEAEADDLSFCEFVKSVGRKRGRTERSSSR